MLHILSCREFRALLRGAVIVGSFALAGKDSPSQAWSIEDFAQHISPGPAQGRHSPIDRPNTFQPPITRIGDVKPRLKEKEG
jgi:hypothetical protein